jgi:predicted enzyme related to lactoylglutathione lyase
MSTDSTSASKLDWRLELIQVPVADVGRAKNFYVQAGFIAEHDHQLSDELRFVQLTPPGSACSISLTSGAHQMEPGSLEGVQLVVADVDTAREELLAREIEVSDVQEFPWGRFVFFADPDGNRWAVQQIG